MPHNDLQPNNRAGVPGTDRGLNGGTVVLTKVRVPQSSSMPVERLDAMVDRAYDHRLALVVAPAGSGKTTLLARLAQRASSVVGWYRAEGWDREERDLVRHLEAAVADSLPGIARGWRDLADVVNALDAWPTGRVLLVIDDLHTLENTPAELALERLVDYAPRTLTIVAASRVPPRFNLPRLRVSGLLLEIGSDDLRLRSWEVERLFRDHYAEPLPPDDIARLARRTDGWAAGLQLFHLATGGRPPDVRRRVLAGLAPNVSLVRDYLTRNVLEQLPFDLRRFLIETSVLGRLSGELCDRLLARTGSAEILAALERNNLFTHALSEDGLYRYHEVLRSHLEGVLLEELGDIETRRRFAHAGELLLDADALPEALEAFCRAEDWEMVQALAGNDAGRAADKSGAWLDAIPPNVLRHDPWLLLASARRLRAEGRFREAVDTYQQAAQAFTRGEPAQLCREEARAINSWLDAAYSPPPSGWPSLLRAAVTKDPLHVARTSAGRDELGAQLVAGLAWLVAGHVTEADRSLTAVAESDTVGPVAAAIAGVASAVAGLLRGQPHSARVLDGAVLAAESIGLEWLARIGRAGLALSGEAEQRSEARAIAAACDTVGDRWGAVLARFFASWGARDALTQQDQLDAVTHEFRALGAPVLEAWALGLKADRLAGAGSVEAYDAARHAEAAARSAGVDAALGLAYGALATVLPETSDYAELAEAIGRETGLAALIQADGDAVRSPVDAASRESTRREGRRRVPSRPLRVRLLGQFEFERGGERIDVSTLRPRVRSLLHLLSVDADRVIHHEAIEAALWPDAGKSAASRNLHVAVASLRRVLEPSAARSFQLVRREGDGYRLAVPPGGEVDIQQFEQAMALGRAARQRGQMSLATEAFDAAMAEYRGDLLPEEGPVEWISERRESLRLAYVEAAQALAELLLARGDVDRAAHVCTEGLRVERYHDPLWRLLINARDRAGDHGAATRARHGYDKMLAELGVRRDGAPTQLAAR